MKKLLALASLLILVSTCVGTATGGEKKIRIGLCMASLDTFLGYVADAAVARAAQLPNVELIVMDAQDDTVRQNDQAVTLIHDGVDALIVNAVEANAVTPVVAAAKDAGIPLVFVNRNPFYGKTIPPNNYVVAPNTILEGATGMEFAAEKMGGKGGIAIIMGTLGHEATANRTEGVKSVLREKYPDIKVIAEETGNWFRDQGMIAVENLITAHGDKINAVLANNDEMALGAILALDAMGMKDVIVVGIDGTHDAVHSISRGKLTASVYQDPIAQGAGSVDVAVKVVSGESMPQMTLLPVELITKDNAAKFAKK